MKIRPQKHLREAMTHLPGWALVGMSSSGHYRLRHAETGATISLASSPGDRRNLETIKRTASVALRVAKERRT